MLFKDLKQGYQVYVIKRGDVSLELAKVINVSLPHLDSSPGSTPQMSVDLTLEIDGKTTTFSIPEASSATYSGDLALMSDKENAVREVEAMKSQSEDAIASVPHHRKVVENCVGILSELNPSFKKEREHEERLSRLEDTITQIKEMIGNIARVRRD